MQRRLAGSYQWTLLCCLRRPTAKQIDAWVARHISDPMKAAPQTENEEERIIAIRQLGLLSGQSKLFDEVAAKVAAAFGTAIALMTVIDEEHQHWAGAVGLPEKLDACRMSDRETSICGHVVAANDMLIIEDVAKDPRFANNPFLLENGIRFYAGAPLRTSAGTALGSLCVIDLKPRPFSPEDGRHPARDGSAINDQDRTRVSAAQDASVI